jgi:hypothetical protein
MFLLQGCGCRAAITGRSCWRISGSPVARELTPPHLECAVDMLAPFFLLRLAHLCLRTRQGSTAKNNERLNVNTFREFFMAFSCS